MKDYNTLAQAIAKKGLGTVMVQADGEIQRFSVPGETMGKQSGWYVSKGAWGVFGNWKTGEKFNWFRGKLTEEEKASAKVEARKARQQYKKAKKEYQAIVAADVQAIFKSIKKPNDDHQYLVKKGIQAYDVGSKAGVLHVPMYYRDELVSCQRIYKDGNKRFWPGGRVNGCHMVINSKGEDKPKGLIITEGYATGASLHEHTEHVVVVAFTAGNLMKVAQAFRKEFPETKIVIAADNDVDTKGNPGLTKAKEAANVIQGQVMYPDFEGLGFKGTDFNDLLSNGGTLDEAISRMKPLSKSYPNIPGQYLCTDDGVFQLNDGGNKQITHKPVWVKASSTNEMGSNSSLLVCWVDGRNNDREMAIPKRAIHAQGIEAALTLIDEDLSVIRNEENMLIEYLAAFDVKTRLTSVNCSGWVGESFVLPHTVIRPPAGEALIYQPHGSNNTAAAIRTKGTLQEWQQGIAGVSPLVQFLVCAALSVPVRYKVGIEAGGFHIYNATSQGKTTALQAAASVWGNGVDPAIAGGSEAYIQKWNATSNSMEAKAEIFNDLPLIIDELGEADAKDFGAMIYKIIGGTGKGRANIHGGARDSKSWRNLLLSAGEVSIIDFIESGGTPMRGGQAVRLVDIDLTACDSLFKNAKEADEMKIHCANQFGIAGPQFLEATPDLKDGWETFDHNQVGNADTTIAERVRKRFALVAYTGLKAITAGVLPWTDQQVMDSVKQAYEAWQTNMSIISDVDRGIQSVKDFLLTNASRFEISGLQEQPLHNRAGWYRDDMYHFTPKAFKNACEGMDPTKVKKALFAGALLHKSGGTRLTSNISAGGTSVRVVSVKKAILAK